MTGLEYEITGFIVSAGNLSLWSGKNILLTRYYPAVTLKKEGKLL